MTLTNKIGVMVDSFNVGLDQGLLKARNVGADGVQIYAGQGYLDPVLLTNNDVKELKDKIYSLGLEVSALCGEIGHLGFQDKRQNRARIVMLRGVIDLAKRLGTNIITTHIGIIPGDVNSEIYSTLVEACNEIGEYASRMDAALAIETGPEEAARLLEFLENLSTKGMAVNFDPANMVMVTGDDPVKGITLLRKYIVHTHVKDGIQLRKADPRDIYGYLGYEAKADEANLCTREVPLGEGEVDFEAYFKALQSINYTGYLTVERETGVDPEADIRMAVQFIKRFRSLSS